MSRGQQTKPTYQSVYYTFFFTHFLSSPGLCISTSINTSLPLSCDVVSNGAPTGNWQVPTIQFTGANQPMLWLSIDPSAPGVGALTQPVTTIYDYEFTTSHASWNMMNETGLIGSAGDTADPINFNGTLICDSNGWSNYTISLFMDGFDPITIFFQKQCVRPMFDIGTFIGDNNVMAMSKPVNTFSSYIFTGLQSNVSFEVVLNTEQTDILLNEQPFSLTMISSSPTELQVVPLGVQGWNGYAFIGLEFEINAQFNCIGDTSNGYDIPITGVLDFVWSKPITFSFHYRCNAGEPVPALTIGTSSGLADIAANGKVVSPWDTTFIYSPDQTYNFNLAINSPQVNHLPYNITMMSEDSAIFTFLPISATFGFVSWDSQKNPKELLFLSTIECQAEGTTRGLVQLEFGPYAPVTIQFRYTCSFPMFNVGDEPLSNNIVAGGVDQGWVGHVGASANSINIYIKLDPSNPVPSNPYELSVSKWSNDILLPTFSDPNLGNATSDPKTDKLPITIHFNCRPCVEQFASSITFQLYWYWSGPAVITFQKDCVPTDEEWSQCDSGSGSQQWTAAGIFFFVLFLVITSFCISGCVYNRFKLDKSGVAIVPGATTFLNYVDKCRNRRSNGWSPQDDAEGPSYQSGFASASSGHANYSTNL